MSYRVKLLALIALTLAATVGLVTWIVSSSVRRAFERMNSQRTAALVQQFREEFARRGADVTRQVEGIAGAVQTEQLALQITRSAPDYAPFVNEAAHLAFAHQLDFLELLAADGAIISSAQWPARFGYKQTWLTERTGWEGRGAFLKSEELADETALALLVVRPVRVGEQSVYLAGGKRLGGEFLSSLRLPAGMRALLYTTGGASKPDGIVVDGRTELAYSDPLRPLITAVRERAVEQAQTVRWSGDPLYHEVFHALPLLGQDDEVLGMFLVGASLREQVQLSRTIRLLAVLVGCGGLLLGMLLAAWSAARVTRPVEQLAEAARQVADGRWDTRVEVTTQDEIGRLAEAFNSMTAQLVSQRDQLVQAERVAAWRELARRLAHELKNPLFPLQITVENLLRARQNSDGQFDEVFRESTATLLAELAQLRSIVGRFSDFARMPAPRVEPVELNEVVRQAVRVFDAQLAAPDRPAITKELALARDLKTIQADPEMLQRAVQNLILNAIDAMPDGGKLTLRTASLPDGVQLDVSDTGKGLNREECERLFTPYYTTKQHGTGLGLAIVQSVVSDHRGRISVESEPGRGTTFRIVLPRQGPPPLRESAASRPEPARETIRTE
jgi:signal transduction histidine kinase